MTFPQNWFNQGLKNYCLQSINSLILFYNKEELPDLWKEYIIIPIHKKGDKTNCNNYQGISLLSTSYKILSNIHLSM
jgi:hypothetical protein